MADNTIAKTYVFGKAFEASKISEKIIRSNNVSAKPARNIHNIDASELAYILGKIVSQVARTGESDYSIHAIDTFVHQSRLIGDDILYNIIIREAVSWVNVANEITSNTNIGPDGMDLRLETFVRGYQCYQNVCLNLMKLVKVYYPQLLAARKPTRSCGYNMLESCIDVIFSCIFGEIMYRTSMNLLASYSNTGENKLLLGICGIISCNNEYSNYSSRYAGAPRIRSENGGFSTYYRAYQEIHKLICKAMDDDGVNIRDTEQRTRSIAKSVHYSEPITDQNVFPMIKFLQLRISKYGMDPRHYRLEKNTHINIRGSDLRRSCTDYLGEYNNMIKLAARSEKYRNSKRRVTIVTDEWVLPCYQNNNGIMTPQISEIAGADISRMKWLYTMGRASFTARLADIDVKIDCPMEHATILDLLNFSKKITAEKIVDKTNVPLFIVDKAIADLLGADLISSVPTDDFVEYTANFNYCGGSTIKICHKN